MSYYQGHPDPPPTYAQTSQDIDDTLDDEMMFINNANSDSETAYDDEIIPQIDMVDTDMPDPDMPDFVPNNQVSDNSGDSDTSDQENLFVSDRYPSERRQAIANASTALHGTMLSPNRTFSTFAGQSLNLSSLNNTSHLMSRSVHMSMRDFSLVDPFTPTNSAQSMDVYELESQPFAVTLGSTYDAAQESRKVEQHGPDGSFGVIMTQTTTGETKFRFLKRKTVTTMVGHANFDVWCNIFSFTEPWSLFRLLRVCKSFKRALDGRRNEHIWKDSILNYTPAVPIPWEPLPFSHRTLARLLFGKGCTGCNKQRSEIVVWECAQRFCRDCRAQFLRILNGNTPKPEQHIFPQLLDVIPVSIIGSGNKQDRVALHADIAEAMRIYNEMNSRDARGEIDEYVATKRTQIQAFTARMINFQQWRNALKATNPEPDYRDAKLVFFTRRAKDEIPHMTDAVLATIPAFKNACNIKISPPSEQQWTILKEKILDQLAEGRALEQANAGNDLTGIDLQNRLKQEADLRQEDNDLRGKLSLIARGVLAQINIDRQGPVHDYDHILYFLDRFKQTYSEMDDEEKPTFGPNNEPYKLRLLDAVELAEYAADHPLSHHDRFSTVKLRGMMKCAVCRQRAHQDPRHNLKSAFLHIASKHTDTVGKVSFFKVLDSVDEYPYWVHWDFTLPVFPRHRNPMFNSFDPFGENEYIRIDEEYDTLADYKARYGTVSAFHNRQAVQSHPDDDFIENVFHAMRTMAGQQFPTKYGPFNTLIVLEYALQRAAISGKAAPASDEITSFYNQVSAFSAVNPERTRVSVAGMTFFAGNRCGVCVAKQEKGKRYTTARTNFPNLKDHFLRTHVGPENEADWVRKMFYLPKAEKLYWHLRQDENEEKKKKFDLLFALVDAGEGGRE